MAKAHPKLKFLTPMMCVTSRDKGNDLKKIKEDTERKIKLYFKNYLKRNAPENIPTAPHCPMLLDLKPSAIRFYPPVSPVLSLVQGNISSFLPTPPCITASHCMASSNRNFSL